jgi:hypothetical protein
MKRREQLVLALGRRRLKPEEDKDTCEAGIDSDQTGGTIE